MDSIQYSNIASKRRVPRECEWREEKELEIGKIANKCTTIKK